jgi:hypothetical protein
MKKKIIKKIFRYQNALKLLDLCYERIPPDPETPLFLDGSGIGKKKKKNSHCL